MKPVLEYLPSIPQIPEHLLMSVQDIYSLEDNSISGVNGRPDSYRKFPVNAELEQWLRPHFPDCDAFEYQMIKRRLKGHKDVRRTSCYNYVVHTGGPQATTAWWQDDQQTLVLSEHIPENIWHKIAVDVFHSVTGLTDVRYTITVYKALSEPLMENFHVRFDPPI